MLRGANAFPRLCKSIIGMGSFSAQDDRRIHCAQINLKSEASNSPPLCATVRTEWEFLRSLSRSDKCCLIRL
jgi:hypothetical protein